jgi:putative transcriptional regulator
MPLHAENPPSSTPPARAAEVIRAWRLRMSMTQEELAQALNVTFSTVSRWENGHVQPSKLAWRALQQLAAARGCPLEEAPSARSA